MNPWLGAERGFLSGWVTQQWVRVTGRRVDLRAAPWLRGPCGRPEGVFARRIGQLQLPLAPLDYLMTPR